MTHLLRKNCFIQKLFRKKSLKNSNFFQLFSIIFSMILNSSNFWILIIWKKSLNWVNLLWWVEVHPQPKTMMTPARVFWLFKFPLKTLSTILNYEENHYVSKPPLSLAALEIQDFLVKLARSRSYWFFLKWKFTSTWRIDIT